MKEKYRYAILKHIIPMDYDSIYLASQELKGQVTSHGKRPIIRVANKNNPKKYILRKIRAKSIEGLTSETLCIDFLSAKELELEIGSFVLIKKSTIFDKYHRYLRKHPNEDIRLAHSFFILSIAIGFVSVVLGIISLLK
jgi:hypothetical protein